MRPDLRIVVTAVAVLGTAACAGTRTGDEGGSLRALAVSSGTYLCADGERNLVTYYRLSDNSLQFVKVVLPGGKEHTLPNVVSASGARYTDEREVVWWTKGNAAFVETRDADGKWRISSKDCHHIGAGD